MKKITVKWIKEEHWEKPKGYLCINENDAKCLPIASPYWNKRLNQDNYLIVERSPFISLTYAECVVKGIEQALEHGFEMDEKAQKQYNYWNKKYIEELELRKSLETKEEKNIEQEKAKLDYDYKYFCNQEGCVTTYEYCQKCKYHFLMGCVPALVKVRI